MSMMNGALVAVVFAWFSAIGAGTGIPFEEPEIWAGDAIAMDLFEQVPKPCQLVLWCVLKIVKLPSLGSIPRDLDCLDVYSGVGNFRKQVNARRLWAEMFDLLNYPGQGYNNVLHHLGFAVVIVLCLRLRVGGLLPAGFDCSSFIWFSQKQYQRKIINNFEGDTSVPKVRYLSIYIYLYISISIFIYIYIICMYTII